MARSSHPSQPSSQEHNLRRLSHGSTTGEKPIRAQTVMTVVAVLIVVAVPLYLLRRPATGSFPAAADTASQPFGGVVRSEADAGVSTDDVLLGPLQRVRCGPSATQQTGEGGLCDALPLLEGALRQSIVSNVDCAPHGNKEGSINYVLEVDFSQNRLNVFAGKSGSWRGARVRRAVTCVQRSLPPLPWTEIAHQHQYYAIAILASYPADEAVEGLPTFD